MLGLAPGTARAARPAVELAFRPAGLLPGSLAAGAPASATSRRAARRILARSRHRRVILAPLAAAQPHLVERDVALAVNMMLERMTAWLAGGGRIEIRGFGSFSLRYRRARMARDPRTGAPVSIGARHAPHFKPGVRLRARVDARLKTSKPEAFAHDR